MATLAVASSPISRQSSTKRAHTLRSARPLSLRKSAIVLCVWREPTQQPHDLDIASGLSFQPPARLNQASGHVDHVNRPNTWLHRPMLYVKKVLAKLEPSKMTGRRAFAGHRAWAMVAYRPLTDVTKLWEQIEKIKPHLGRKRKWQ